MELVRKNFPKITWEINYWYMMNEMFSTYSSNHNDNIFNIPENFNQITTKLDDNQIINFIIFKFFNYLKC